MTLQDHEFVVSFNPRTPRSCVKCGRIPDFHPAGRDVEIEESFMADVATLADQLSGMSSNPAAISVYRRTVSERLALGEERYGPMEFLNRDNLVELAEETPDCSSYGLLEVERQERAGLDPDRLAAMRAHLVTAAAYAALADEQARLAKYARDGDGHG